MMSSSELGDDGASQSATDTPERRTAMETATPLRRTMAFLADIALLLLTLIIGCISGG